MLTSLTIKNFRIFDELRINKLSSVNLFVGKNNSGKSCLLEAIQVYATNGNLSLLYDLVTNRDEHWEQLVQSAENKPVEDIDNPLRHIFRGYHFPEVGDRFIEIGSVNDIKSRIMIGVRAYQITKDEEGRRLRVPLEQTNLFSEQKDFVDLQLGIVAIVGGEERFIVPMSADPRDPLFRRRLIPFAREGYKNIQLVPTRNIDDNRIGALWDNINLTNFQDEVVECLRLVEPSITGVALVGEATDPRYPRSNQKRIPIVRTSGSDDRIALKTMGDGITRLFHIILSLVNANDGYLLIDEFENGIHWSVQYKLWEIIFRLSRKLNVQVFATTHSRDCVKSFFSTWKQQEELGSFSRLESKGSSGATAISYSSDMLADAIDTDVEVR